MDKLVRKIEIPLAKQRIQNAGLYIVPEERLAELSEVAADAYQDDPTADTVVRFANGFGVCGTDLKTKDITLSGGTKLVSYAWCGFLLISTILTDNRPWMLL